jgi:imidazolonepropionase-like amidohydrolase/ABC-type multidrug transport system permease subunit
MMMKAYVAYVRQNLRLTFRDKTVLFFNYLFPLIFFFIFGQMSRADRGGAAAQVVTMVLTIGILGGGFFGAGIRAVMDREQNILRRFKVAPITPGPIVFSSLVSGLTHYVPVAIGVIMLGHFMYGMPWPERWFSLSVFIAAGVIAFRAMGGIIAAVCNSMAESQIVIQLLYFPMLFLSGATIPISALPDWVQTLAQFLPSTHLFNGLQTIIIRKESLLDNGFELLAMVLTTIVGTFIAVKLFRWEKDETIPAASKAWIVGVMLPFAVLGVWQYKTKENIAKSKTVDRQMRRERSRMFKDARVIVGDGTVLDRASVLIRNGKIEEIYTQDAPDDDKVKADVVQAAGKTLIPGLIDTHVHLGAPGGYMDFSKMSPQDMQDPSKAVSRELAAYLYSGITAVRSVGDWLEVVEGARAKIESGEKSGAELFYAGPMFTVDGGHGTEYFRGAPEEIRKRAEAQMLRLPGSAAEARQMVFDLKQHGAHAIKAILEAGYPGRPFNRMDTSTYLAIAAACKEAGIPLATHTGNLRDLQDAIDGGTASIEHGSFMEEIPASMFAAMKAKNIAYAPTMMVYESMLALSERKTDMLDRSLVQQVGPMELLRSSKEWIQSGKVGDMSSVAPYLKQGFELAKKNLLHAQQAGVKLVTGSDAGNPGVVHGPTVHRELQLWVEAGVPAAVALQGATANAAALLGAGNRTGQIRKGFEASVVLLDGNPLQDISATERISLVLLKGERIDRPGLFESDKEKDKNKDKK